MPRKSKPTKRRSSKRTKRRSWVRRLATWALGTGMTAGAVGAWLYHQHVVVDPGSHVGRDHVHGIIAQESPVYYRDGTTRIGVFFEDEHRRYVPWEELPRAYVASIVAAEDSRFWSHPGFDLIHIARAMRDNIAAGGLVAGGSTLTQQTAKNLYYRPDRSLRSKLIEALNALRLEHHFDKSEILTFYANQFHVSGNGRGLGIAARHFFDKEPADLTVLECAFLAGLVKAPSYYDPFIGDEARRARAIERAHDRTRYVLRRLTELDADELAGPYPEDSEDAEYRGRRVMVRKIQDEARELLNADFELPFRRGVFRFDSSAVLDEVARRLGEPPFADVLAEAGIDDPATAGLKVVTTLDVHAQRAATYGLWHHLTEVGVMLEGLEPEAFLRSDARGPRYDPQRTPEPGTFRLATVSAVVEDNGRRHLELDLGGTACTVDRGGIVRAAVAVHRGSVKSTTAKTNTAGANAMADALPVGSVVWVSVREVGEAGALCDLELHPELQGAVVVLEDGQVRAMVGGNDNRNFNRTSALRQMGSTWKPLVYHAAMQLGWDSADVLDNRRSVFPFSTTFYYPRPDHAPDPEITMAWSGVRSENLASVWLLYHLVDRLSFSELVELADAMGLARAEDEEEDDYRLRIQQSGVLPTPSRVREALFLEARHEVASALERSPRREEVPSLMSLSYGWGFSAERRRVNEGWKRAALDWSWGTVSSLRERCGDQYGRLITSLDAGVVPPAGSLPDLRFLRPEDGPVAVSCGEPPEDYVASSAEVFLRKPEAEPEGTAEEGDTPARRRPRGAAGRLLGRMFAPRMVPVVDEAEMWIGGRIRASTVDEVSSAMTRLRLRREVQGQEAPGLYEPEVLYWHQDFRVLLALKYVHHLAEQFGVQTEVREVLSMPLGASEITLEEAAMVYGGITSGSTWRFPGRVASLDGVKDVAPPAASTLLIAEIRDVDDRVLYRGAPERTVVTSVAAGAMTTDILEHVVTSGTGRRASGAVSLGGAELPLAGKTGTTNSFRNAAFLGTAPIIDGPGLRTGRSMVVGVYVGYDDNRSMVSGRIKLAGASGALPAWVQTVRGLSGAELLGKSSLSAPEDGWVRDVPAGLELMAVDPATGLLAEAATESTVSVLARDRAPVLAVASPVDEHGAARRTRIAPRTLDVDAYLEDRLKQAGGRKGLWPKLKKRRKPRPAE